MAEATMRSDGDAAEIIGQIMAEMEEVFALIREPANPVTGSRSPDPKAERGADRAAPLDVN